MARNSVVAIFSRTSYRLLSHFGVNVSPPALITNSPIWSSHRLCFLTGLQPVANFITLHNSGVKVVGIRTRGQHHPPTTTSSIKFESRKTMSSQSGVIEAVVARVSDLENGQMKEVEVGGKPLLLVKDDGQFYAIGNKCTHYGAPLSKGAYCNGKVRCPWHGACFNVRTGDIEDFPGLDSVHTFQVTLRGEEVVVTANLANLENTRRVKSVVKKSGKVEQTAVLVGGGPSSLVCAQTLREEGFRGHIKMVCKEPHPPYDRVKLSKALGSKVEEIELRSKDYYDTNGIELLLGKEVTSLSPSSKTVSLSDGHTVKYDYLLLATGGQPRRLPIPGVDLHNVFYLRTVEDANVINQCVRGKHVVVIGSSFIGLELATCLVGKATSVHVVGQSSRPLQNVVGLEIGTWIQKLHESKGVRFQLETTVKELQGSGGHVTRAVLSNGQTLQADVVVMGVGVVPATDFLKESGLEMTKGGFIPVNKRMETNLPGVFAAGDIVEFPLFTQRDNLVNVQHFQMAHKHGRTAGLAMAGNPLDVHSVPYFWTVQFGKSVRYCGYGPGYDDVIIHGSLDQHKFVAFYTKGDVVVAVASLGWDPVVSQVAEFLSGGGQILKEDVRSDPTAVWLPKLGGK